ncbi:MAG: hypothetical protein DRJ59_02555 [Thermoprotei archaeon]|nr:MAG: hypothetical protein DRJ59_02555 [Thermoprotei archaeon]
MDDIPLLPLPFPLPPVPLKASVVRENLLGVRIKCPHRHVAITLDPSERFQHHTMVFCSNRNTLIEIEWTGHADKVKCLEWYKPMLRVTEQMGIKGRVALDVGCSYGYVTDYLRAKGAEAFALDIDPTVLREHSVKSYFIRGDATHLPIRDEVLDLIITSKVVEHLKNMIWL